MFPLTNKEPYIKSSGERTTLGDMFADAGGDISELEQEIQALTNYVADTGVKNVCPFDIDYIKSANTSSWNGNTYTQNNVSFVYDNGTVTISGVPPAVTSPKYAKFSLPAGNYIMSGCPAGGADNTYNLWIGVRNASDTDWTTTHKDYGNGVAFTVYEDTSYVRIETEIRPAYDGSTKVFKPMIRDASITDPTYQPYAMTNKELTDSKADKSDLASISITGTTNNTGATITSGTYFYLNGALVKAKTSIANGATLTENTNYTKVTAGSLNELGAYSKSSSNGIVIERYGHMVHLFTEGAVTTPNVIGQTVVSDSALRTKTQITSSAILRDATAHTYATHICYVKTDGTIVFLTEDGTTITTTTDFDYCTFDFMYFI